MYNKKNIEKFWGKHICGFRPYSHKNLDEYYKNLSTIRYKEHHELKSLINFKNFKGKKILEIGIGSGNDASEFVKYGADYTGIDLASEAVKFTQERLNHLFGKGSVIQGNAEKLPFKDNSFDFVYSFGVIHHADEPLLIVNEIQRVLKKESSFFVMLYNRHSTFYYLEILIFRRLLLIMSFLYLDKLFLFLIPNKDLRFKGNNYFYKLSERYKRQFFISNQELLNHSTDGVDCPLSRVYSKNEAKKLFSNFKNLKSNCFYIEKKHSIVWILLGSLLKYFENLLSKKFGWFRIIEGSK